MSPYSNLPHSNNALRAFEAVARLASFTLAAEELYVTQSAVSRQVKLLEQELDVPLVIRHHRSIELTEKGVQLAQALNQNYQALQVLFESWQAPKREKIVIKAALTYATRCLIPKIHQLSDRYPEHDIVIIPSLEEEASLNDGDYDLLIFSSRKKNSYHDLRHVTFLRDEYMAPVCRTSSTVENQDIDSLLTMRRLHSTLGHDDWNDWLASHPNAPLGPVRDTTFFTLDLALSACLSGQGSTVTDLLLILPELQQQFLYCPVGTKVKPGAWQYYCHKRTQTPIIEEIIEWIVTITQQDIEALNALARQNDWSDVGKISQEG
ncbi:LysR family transcriptional regulator [Vibrio sp. 10N.261.55.A7]|uniref:LysR family transcriptional regulator n=1 Tax=Vibrio sp. 10N.261.55.A7 TaxID=1880851 RepID=UPI000C8507FD|nr:LysR family transcriptional regulator [Vibrio sp. 10N.261.55.A7]PMJ92764.1 LysR family transcriptional regulator [Vibrio sp. 10N.261.55.A7]